MAEKFDKLVKICEEVCKKEFAQYEDRYRQFVTSYTKAIALTATYSAVSNGKSWPKEFFKDSPNPATYGDLFKWMFDKEYGSRYYDEKDVVGEDDSVYLDSITGKEYRTRIEAAGRVPNAPENPEDKGLPDDIIEASVIGNEEIKQIYASLKKNYRDTQNYLTYKKILQEITISVYSEKVVKQYLENVTSEGIRTWTLEKFSEIWRDGLQGKSGMQRDVGIADFVGREYPLYQEVYGGNFWVVIDNPWSKRENPEGPQALADAIREKSPDPDAAKGTTASGTTASGTSASDAASATGPSASTPLKYTPFVEGLPDGYQINAKTDLPDFMIYVSDPNTWKALDAVDPDGQQLDENGEPDEYTEEKFNSDEESPPNNPDPIKVYDTKEDEGSGNVNDTNTSSQPGSDPNYSTVVKLPTGRSAYSHNSSQGYNLVDSKWYGDLLTSARQHIDHPTFDIPGTESGNLGCASWVSMVFYRAFGVSMKDGKAVVAVPKSISKFGSTGTGELGGWFAANPTMWEKIPWKEGKPGDVINTERGSKSGHVGIVMDEMSPDGTWKVASNSSKGFGSSSDPAGCGKLNYTIKAWQSVTNRNPSRTFCWRYKGPKLPQGQTA